MSTRLLSPDRPARGAGSPMRDCLLLLASLAVLPPPVMALMVDRILGIPARAVLLASAPAFFLLSIIFFFTYRKGHRLCHLLCYGLIAGLLGTLALDTVRLGGVRIGAFPMDLPRMFGVIAAGKAPEFQANTVATIVRLTAELPEKERRRVMQERVRFLAGLDETSRRAFMGAMAKGLMGLPSEKRAKMVETQMSLILKLEGEESRAMSASMSATMGMTSAVPKFPSGIELFLQVPQVPMAEFRRASGLSYPLTLRESGLTDFFVSFLGYLWHFMIGATFGITYTLLFGRGNWGLAFGWGTFVWAMMMLSMPLMMPMIAFPWKWFPIIPLVAHLAMAVPIGWVAHRFVDDAADAKSLLGLLRSDGAGSRIQAQEGVELA